MFVSKLADIKSINIEGSTAKAVFKQVLVGPEQGWEGWVMRMFTLGEAGHTPRHSHPWPHINYIVKGRGNLYLDGSEYQLAAGHTAFIPADLEHQFSNNSSDDFQFICIVPEEGDK